MKYILLNAVKPADFKLNTIEELQEAAAEFACGILTSTGTNNAAQFFFTAKDKRSLEIMCDTVDLPGVVVEVSAVFDNVIIEETTNG